MTPEEAYGILTKGSSLKRLGGCLDFGNFYVFCIVRWFEDPKDNYLSGTVFDAVDKKTGKIFEYDITSDPDAYFNAKEISIKTMLDTPISEFVEKLKE